MAKTRRGEKARKFSYSIRVMGLFLSIGLSGVVVSGCDYARMRDQESVRTYETEMPGMDRRTVPLRDGYQTLLSADPKNLTNPHPQTPESVEKGRQAYGFFCIQCHGRNADGRGTVGQSFSPLPTNLTSQEVQSQTDGELYAKTRLGFRRHPNLYTTVSESDTWAVINYVRSIDQRNEKNR